VIEPYKNGCQSPAFYIRHTNLTYVLELKKCFGGLQIFWMFKWFGILQMFGNLIHVLEPYKASRTLQMSLNLSNILKRKNHLGNTIQFLNFSIVDFGSNPMIKLFFMVFWNRNYNFSWAGLKKKLIFLQIVAENPTINIWMEWNLNRKYYYNNFLHLYFTTNLFFV
jgi:hypothetical protein